MRVSRSLSRKGHVILLAALHHARRMLACLALGTAVLIVPANAATVPTALDPGQTANPLPNFAAGIVPFLPSPFYETFSFGNPTGPGPSGTLTEVLGNDAPSSPFGPGGSIFAYSVDVTEGDVQSISFEGFSGYSTAVKTCDASCLEGEGTVPYEATRSSGVGDTISFVFATALTGSSGGFSIYTNATTYTDPPVVFYDSADNSVSVDALGPAGATTPLPTSWTMMLIGLVGFVFVAHRRKSVLTVAVAP